MDFAEILRMMGDLRERSKKEKEIGCKEDGEFRGYRCE
jgi:hypothetical protein